MARPSRAATSPWTAALALLSLATTAPSTAAAALASNASSSDASDAGDEAGVDVDLLFSTPAGRRGLDDMELAPLIAACVAMLVGVALALAGARVLRYAALGCAFFDGAFGTAALLEKLLAHAQWSGVVSWTVFFLGGVFCCLLVVSLAHGDVLCLGVTAGLLTAFTGLTTVGYRLAPDHPHAVLYALLVVFGVGACLLTLKTRPVSVVPATSWIGSNVAAWGVGYFFGEFPNATAIEKYRRASDGTYVLPAAWWGYLAGTLALFLLGVAVQVHTVDFAERRRPQQQHHHRRSTRAGTGHTAADTRPRDAYASMRTPSRHSTQRRAHCSHIV